MLRAMEEDFGLQDLSQAEMDVLLAAHATRKQTGPQVTSEQIRQQPLVAHIAQATFHRALRALVAKGLIAKAQGFKARHYIVRISETALPAGPYTTEG